MSQDQIITFDDIDLEGVDAAPSFDTPPSGIYIVEVSMAQKLIGEKKKRAVEVNMVLREVVQIGTQHTEKPSDPGQQFSILYFCDSPEKYGYLKRDLAVFFEAIGTTSLNTMVKTVQSLPVKVVLNYNKLDYLNATYEII